MKNTEKQYEIAKQQYAEIGVDTEDALKQLQQIPISIHCWQGDDVGGYEKPDAVLGAGGTLVTGNFRGKARTIKELRADIEKMLSLVPGKNRLNLHANYGEFGGKLVDRNEIETSHFQGWVDWASQQGIMLDFNCTLFSHPKVDSGFTISEEQRDKGILD